MSDPHETLRLLDAVRKTEPFTDERAKAMSAFQFNAIKYADVYAARLIVHEAREAKLRELVARWKNAWPGLGHHSSEYARELESILYTAAPEGEDA